MQIWISIVEVFDDQTPSEIHDSLVFFLVLISKVENSQQHMSYVLPAKDRARTLQLLPWVITRNETQNPSWIELPIHHRSAASIEL